MALFIGVAHAATDPAAEGGGVGLPQLDPAVFAPQIFWLLVALVVLYVLMAKVALPRIGRAIEDRHDAIEDDLDRATDLKLKAEEAEQAYDRALARAKAEATRIADAAKAEVQKKLDAATAEADEKISAQTAESAARIAEIRDGAMASVQEVATDTAGALVEALAPESADAEAIRDAVARRMEA